MKCALVLVLMLSGCAGTAIKTTCPPPRYANEAVGEEMATIPFEGYEDLWFYMADMEILNNQLSSCQ